MIKAFDFDQRKINIQENMEILHAVQKQDISQKVVIRKEMLSEVTKEINDAIEEKIKEDNPEDPDANFIEKIAHSAKVMAAKGVAELSKRSYVAVSWRTAKGCGTVITKAAAGNGRRIAAG